MLLVPQRFLLFVLVLVLLSSRSSSSPCFFFSFHGGRCNSTELDAHLLAHPPTHPHMLTPPAHPQVAWTVLCRSTAQDAPAADSGLSRTGMVSRAELCRVPTSTGPRSGPSTAASMRAPPSIGAGACVLRGFGWVERTLSVVAVRGPLGRCSVARECTALRYSINSISWALTLHSPLRRLVRIARSAAVMYLILQRPFRASGNRTRIRSSDLPKILRHAVLTVVYHILYTVGMSSTLPLWSCG
jgi:hypothetical protein